MTTILLLFVAFIQPGFSQILFDPIQTISDSANGVRDVHTADLDGDGDMDVLSVSAAYNKIAWYENDGNGNFGNQQIITTDQIYAISVFAATSLAGACEESHKIYPEILSVKDWASKNKHRIGNRPLKSFSYTVLIL